MIKSFRCKDTEKLFGGHCPPSFRAFQRVAERKLAQLNAATTLEFLRSPPGNHLEAWAATARDSTASASTTNGGCALSGATATPMLRKSWTITEETTA